MYLIFIHRKLGSHEGYVIPGGLDPATFLFGYFCSIYHLGNILTLSVFSQLSHPTCLGGSKEKIGNSFGYL